MKPRNLKIFFSLAAILSLILLFILSSLRSAEEHAVVAGLSGPRAVMAALLLSAFLIFTGFWLLFTFNTTWLFRVIQSIDDQICRADTLLVVSSYTLFLALAFPVLSLLGVLLHYGQVIRRAAELLVWMEGLALLVLAFLWVSYAPMFRRSGFFSDALRRIAQASFISRLSFWLSLGLLALTTLFLLPSSSISMGRVPSHDSGIFLYFGQKILQGKIPFRDLWDHKPPLIFYADALGLLIGRGSQWGVWILEYLALAGSCLLAFFTLHRIYGRFQAALAVCLSLGGLVFLLENGNLTEEFSLPLQWSVIALFAYSDKKGWNGWGGRLRAVLAGSLFSLALNFKQTMIGIWVALFIWLGLRWWFQRQRDLWKVFAWAGFGAILTFAAIVLYFAAHQALGEYWQVAYVYNLVYSDIVPDQRNQAFSDLVNFLTQTSPIFLLSLFTWAAGILVAFQALLKRKLVPGFPLLPALIDLPIELVLISVSGKNYRHYFITLIPVITILIAWGLSMLSVYALRIPRWLSVTGVLLFSGLVLLPTINALAMMSQPPNQTDEITVTVRLVQKETQPGDYLLMWGSQTVVNYLSDRPAPTRFVHQKPLFREGFANAALSAEMLNDLKTHPPRLIINTHLPSTPFLTMGPDGACRYPPDLPDGMADVFTYICQNYTLTQVITKDQWEVFRLEK